MQKSEFEYLTNANYQIKQINDSNIQAVTSLAVEAQKEGFKFVQKTIDEWIGKTNRFSGIGEILWGVFDKGKCIAIGGLNIDPYANDPMIGRVRHLYVSLGYRQKGIATHLLKMIIERSNRYFIVLRLSVHKPGASNYGASKLYEKMGFVREERLGQTHIMVKRQ